MLVREIKYEDFEGNEVTEIHHFHIYEYEFAELEVSLLRDGGVKGALKKMQKADDQAGILALFKQLICMGYGVRDPENPAKFRKTPELLADFMSSPAFDALYTELMVSDTAAITFLTGAVPRKVSSNPKVVAGLEQIRSSGTVVPDPNKLDIPTATWPRSQQADVEDVTKTLPDDTKAWPKDNGPQPDDGSSYLTNPRDENGDLVPWAFREPNNVELTTMSKPQMMDVFRRKSTDWQPYQIR